MERIQDFAQRAREANPQLSAPVASFYAVRDLPYAINAAHDAAALVELGRGDCLAKAELLAQLLGLHGLECRLVRLPYLLPDVVPEVRLLPSRLDLHRAVQVLLEGCWRLVDATHDVCLGPELAVADWDGINATLPAYEPLAKPMVEGQDDTLIAEVVAEIDAWVSTCPAGTLNTWRSAYIRWLDARRS